MINFNLLKSPFFILKQIQLNMLKKNSGLITGSVIDIGSGVAPYKVAIEFDKYTTLDIASLDGVDVVGDIASAPFSEDTFDTAIVTEVLEHVFYPDRALGEIKRVIRPGGIIYLTVPMTWPLHYEPNDYWRFTKYSLIKLVEAAGLELISVERVGGVFSLIGARGVDFLFEAIKRLLYFLSAKNAERVAILLVLPGSLLFYFLGILLDRFDERDALGWVVVARV